MLLTVVLSSIAVFRASESHAFVVPSPGIFSVGRRPDVHGRYGILFIVETMFTDPSSIGCWIGEPIFVVLAFLVTASYSAGSHTLRFFHCQSIPSCCSCCQQQPSSLSATTTTNR